MSLVGFKAKNHRQQVAKKGASETVDERITPPSLYQPLHLEHGFTLDVAASPHNAKCPRYFTRELDGLMQSWAEEVVWCNPPYSNLRSWVEKALLETKMGCPKVVMLLPANRCEQPFWQELIEPLRDRGLGVSTRFLRGRLNFGTPSNPLGSYLSSPPFGLVLVTFTAQSQGRLL